MSRKQLLYGAGDGSWCLLVPMQDWMPPAKLNELMYLGISNDIFVALNYHLKQLQLARFAGVTQQSISRYIDDSVVPELSDIGWANIVGAYYRECLRIPDHRHTVELYKESMKS